MLSDSQLRSKGTMVISAVLVAGAVMAWQASPKAESGAPSWTVQSTADKTSYRQNADEPWIDVSGQASIDAGADVRVEEGAEIVLGNAGDIITASGGSRLTLPDNATLARAGVIQERGRVRYDVESVPSRSFAVDTPYLAVVVKGTKFVVDLDEQDVAVDVEEGVVGVDTYDGRYSVTIEDGQSIRQSLEEGAPLELKASPRATPQIVPAAPAAAKAKGRPFAQADLKTKDKRQNFAARTKAPDGYSRGNGNGNGKGD
ncbi:MAG: FecR family protein [Pseudomonadota bacterium]